jgi:hypothetical protein
MVANYAGYLRSAEYTKITRAAFPLSSHQSSDRFVALNQRACTVLGFNSLRYLRALCVSAVSDFVPILTAETQRTQSLRREATLIKDTTKAPMGSRM